MAVRVLWTPSEEAGATSYDLEKAAAENGPYVLLANVLHDLEGAAYDGTHFFYDDAAGTATNWYRLILKGDAGAQSGPGRPFRPVSVPPLFTHAVKVDQDYGAPGALRYQAQNGTPIEGAVIRIYRKADFDLGKFQDALAITQTNSLGNWVDPIFLDSGQTYTVQFHKEGLYGPDKIEIVV